jgi:GNAT superfamily N-acetyltransferase
MTAVVQMWKDLRTPGEIPSVEGVALRTYSGEDDINAWADLVTRAFARSQPGIAEWDERRFRAEFLDRLWWEPARLWLAESVDDEGQHTLVGTVALGQRGANGPAARPVVHWLAVSRECRGRGVGRLLMATLENASWDRGDRRIWLETHAGWSDALRLYEALGYQRGLG